MVTGRLTILGFNSRVLDITFLKTHMKPCHYNVIIRCTMPKKDEVHKSIVKDKEIQAHLPIPALMDIEVIYQHIN